MLLFIVVLYDLLTVLSNFFYNAQSCICCKVFLFCDMIVIPRFVSVSCEAIFFFSFQMLRYLWFETNIQYLYNFIYLRF